MSSLCGSVCIRCDSEHMTETPVCYYGDQVLAWAEHTNQCLMRRLAGHVDHDERTHCPSVGRRMRADLHACTQLTDVTVCRQLLQLRRQDTIRLFSQLSVRYKNVTLIFLSFMAFCNIRTTAVRVHSAKQKAPVWLSLIHI